MNTALTAPRMEQQISELRKLDTEELRQALADEMAVTAERVMRLAAIVRVLEERGEPIEDLRLGMMEYLRLIAYGQLLPEAVVQYHAQPLLLGRVATLPIPDQERIVRGDSIEVIEIDGEGKSDVRKVPPSKMGRTEIMQVFGRGRIRDISEQRSYLKDHPRKRVTNNQQGVVLDSRRKGITVNGVFIARGELARYLAQLSD